MKKIVLILLISPFLINCQSIKMETDYDWEKFLKKFPTVSSEALQWIPSTKNVGDTISPITINKFLWPDKTRPLTVYKKESDFQFPVGSKLNIGDEFLYRSTTIKGLKCKIPQIIYPFFKISLDENKILLSYLEFEIGEKMIFQPLIILDKSQKYKRVGYFGFIHDHKWSSCDDPLNEILKDTKPWSAPVKLINNGFIIHDRLVGAYYEDELEDQYWTVIIRDDGKFEIVKEEKNYYNLKELWSKEGYFTNDPDGYVNFREEKSSSSKIIKRIDSGTKIEIINAFGDWWEVKVSEISGFIHKSRIQEGKN